MTDRTHTRLATNTAYLYVRMLLLMGVGLYTSRLVLEALGDSGFGTYSIVAGFGVFMTYATNALTGAAQRFLCRDLTARDWRHGHRDFKAALAWGALLGLAAFVVGLPAGALIIEYVLDIPAALRGAAQLAYGLVLINVAVGLLRAPFAALVLARERMGFFSLTSVAEGGVKLGGVFILLYGWPDDVASRVVAYAGVVFSAQLAVAVWQAIYTLRRFPEASLSPRCSKRAWRRMGSFAGWNLFGGAADATVAQGGAMLVNLFYGVTLNATTGFVAQIRTAVFAFTASFQNASNPRIMKCYGQGTERFASLVCLTSRLSFVLMLLIAVPFYFNLEWALTLWLGELPPALLPFTQLTIVCCLFYSLSGPLWSAMQARGRMKLYQLSCGSVMLLNIPIAWLALALWAPPQSVAAVQIGVNIAVLCVRLWFARRYCSISIATYARTVVVPGALCAVAAVVVPAALASQCAPAGGNFWLAVIDACWTLTIIWGIALTRDERRACISLISNRIAPGSSNSCSEQ